MKLTGALIAAVAAEERAFANNEEWMQAYEEWWNPTISVKYFNNIKNGLVDFQTAFDENAPTRIGNFFKRDMAKLVGNLAAAKRRCDAASSSRRRRSNGKGDRTLYPFDNMNVDILKVWGLFAKYTRNEFWHCEANVDVFKFYKRIDRFRWIYTRHYCNHVDNSGENCGWATTAMNGEKFDKPFRQMSWFTNKFGIEATNPFVATEPATTTEAPPVRPRGYTEHNTAWGTVWTKVYDDFYTFEEGEAICANDGDFLHQPIPHNQYENDFFFDLVGTRNDRDMWLGITDNDVEGEWRNTNGDLQTYFNWNGGEPNDWGKKEDNVELILSGNSNQNGKWNDMYNHPSTQDKVAYGNNNLVVCTYTVPNSAPPSRCPMGYMEMNVPSMGNKCVEVNKGKFKITSAVSHCDSNSAELAMPQSDEDNEFFSELIGYQKYDLWIAATDDGSEGTFYNMNDDSALSYTNWNKNEPNNHGAGENYVTIILTDGNDYNSGRNGLWNDIKSQNHSDDADRIAYGSNNAFICIKNAERIPQN